MHVYVKRALAIALIAGACVLLPPALFLANVWRHDAPTPLASALAGTNDASRLNAVRPGEVISVAHDRREAELQLISLVRKASAEHRQIAISGAHHTMGGHTLYPGQLVVDMLPFNHLELDRENRILTVGAGATWSEVIPFLDHEGLAVA